MEAFSAQTESSSKVPTGARQARVTTTARLHFGFLDPSGRGRRPFGSFGLAIDWPRTCLLLAPARSFQVSGPERDRALSYLKALARSCGIEAAYKLHVEEAIPPHAGLGSGTQLALAVGSAFAALERVRLEPEEIAFRLGRGARSGIGVATFEAGGAVLDSGPKGRQLPKLVSRLAFPAEWRVLLILDPKASGLAGANEAAAFVALPEFPETETEELRRRIAEGALPALAAADFATFSEQVGYLQSRMAEYFAPRQGGAHTSPRVNEALAWLRARGMAGLGQSSWGPTGFAFFASEAEGEAWLKRLNAEYRHTALRFALTRGNNAGAKIETSGGEIR
jgi:beta-RFAP synthase